MRYNGNIKNGIELKKSEDNLFQRIIIKILKILKRIFMPIFEILKGENEVWYSLSCDEEKHRYFDKNFLLSYLRDKYLNNKKDIGPTNLSNDLITFKTYRDDVDINVRKQNDFYQFLTIVIGIITILVTIININNTDKIKFIALIPFALAVLAYFVTTTGSHSEAYKLKVINNVIYTLEAIKEDMDKNGYESMKYTEMNSNVNDYQSDDINDEMSTEVKRFTEDDKDIYDGLKLTEVIEVRTYSAKATQNKYSPRAMHERKRR